MGFQQRLAMRLDETLDVAEFRRAEADVRRERNRPEPKFGLALVALDVNVRWLAAFPAVEVEPIRADAENRGHETIVRKPCRCQTPGHLV